MASLRRGHFHYCGFGPVGEVVPPVLLFVPEPNGLGLLLNGLEFVLLLPNGLVLVAPLAPLVPFTLPLPAPIIPACRIWSSIGL